MAVKTGAKEPRIPSRKEMRNLAPVLRRYYRLGQKARKFDFGEKSKLRLLWERSGEPKSDEVVVSRDTVLKARRFVELMSDEESFRLLSQKQKTGRYLSWNHVRYLVSVDNGPRRRKLLKEAVEGNWSRVQLLEAIKLRVRRFSRTETGGRLPAKPQSAQEALLRLQHLTETWLALYKLIVRPRWTQKDETEPEKTVVVPNSLREQIKEILLSGCSPTGAKKFDVQVKEFLRVLRKQQREIAKILVTGEAWLRDQPDDTPASRSSPKRVTRPRRRH